MSWQEQERGRGAATKDIALISSGVLLLLVCIAGAVSTAILWLRIGLGPRPPLSALGTIVRFIGVATALVLWPVRHDRLERAVLFSAVFGGGAAGLSGLGVTSATVAFVRLLCHLLFFSFGAAAIVRWLWRRSGILRAGGV